MKRTIVLAILLLLALLLVVSQPTYAQGPEPVKLRVEVSDDGFRPDTVEVQQGQLVELTFVWNQAAYPNDEHIMVVEGYKLESDKVDSEHRETTLKFIADKPGTFVFRCDLDCQVHDLTQAGHLKVSAGGSASAALQPTKLSLTPSSWVTLGEPVILMAVLRDAQGAPVSKAQVHFLIEAELASNRGEMEFGSARTDHNGAAFLQYRPTIRTMLQKITARFDGMGVYAQADQTIEIRLLGTPPSAYQIAPNGLPGTPAYASLAPSTPSPVTAVLTWGLAHWQETPLVLLVGGVWLAFAFVLFQVTAIAWAGRREVITKSSNAGPYKF